jgi:putative thioredoxin
MDYIIGQKPPASPAGAPGRPGAAAAGQDALIVDGDQRTFVADVIEASRTMPVLVDFWATWCGPCKTLTPALERVVRAAGGRVKLVKIDIDKNRSLVQQLTQLGLPMQSVPTVAAFWQGQIADIFQGALPESEIKRFVEALLKLGGGALPATDLIAEGRAALEANQPEAAADAFSAVLNTDPESPEAWGGMIRALLAMGDEQQASDALAQVPKKILEHAEIAGARSALALAAEGRAAAGQLATYERRLAQNPADHAARYELATALNATGDRAAAAEALLAIVRADRTWNEGAARAQLLKFFEAWGFDDPATMAARRKLSALLFS